MTGLLHDLAPGRPLLLAGLRDHRGPLRPARRRHARRMDSAFFLTRDKNFIPHEYPCRTPLPPTTATAGPKCAAPGLHPRPARPSARPRSTSPASGSAPPASPPGPRPHHCRRRRPRPPPPRHLRRRRPLRERQEAGHLAPYTRNREAGAEITVALAPGDARLTVFFDDLAERDTRFGFQLDWLDGPAARQACPFPADPETVAEVEAALAALHFDRPAYAGGDVTLLLPRPLSGPARATIAIAGDGIHGRLIDLARAATRRRSPSARRAPPRRLPPPPRHPGDRRLRRRPHPRRRDRPPTPGLAPPTSPPRIAEALAAVAAGGEPDTITALARLATGRAGPATEAMITEFLDPITDCRDCADFLLVPLIWSRPLRRRVRGPPRRDRPASPVTATGSTSPATTSVVLLRKPRAVLPYLRLSRRPSFPRRTFIRSGRTGAAQSAVGHERVRAWLDHFERWEMAEFNSAPYFPIDLKGLTALSALSPDADIPARAAAASCAFSKSSPAPLTTAW